MKRTIILAMAIITITSCKKEDEICNCGIIQSDDVTYHSVTIENECSGNEKTFYLSESDWMSAHPGTRHCITNVNKW